jgi:CelD/BcsL family acetyltransferase involved in cellulose biosynthesis
MLVAGISGPPSRVLRTPAELSGLVEGWRALAGRCRVSYFATPDWALAWWKTIGQGGEAQVAVWETPRGDLEALVALIRIRERFHSRVPLSVSAWTNLGAGPGSADHCGWPVLSSRVADVRSWIAARAAGGPMILRSLDTRSGVPFVPASGRLLYRTSCPRMVIPSGGEPVGRSAKFRKRVRAYTRKLIDRGVTFRWVPPEAMNEAVLETLFHLHERRQAMKGRPSIFDRTHQEFHRLLVASGGTGRGPAAILAEHSGRAIGVRYGFMWSDVFAGYQSGWDPAWAPYRLGTVLYSEAIRLSHEAGARVADFLRGTEEWKYRFGAEDRVDETWLVPIGLPARLLQLKYGVKARMERSRSPLQSAERDL